MVNATVDLVWKAGGGGGAGVDFAGLQVGSHTALRPPLEIKAIQVFLVVL